MLTEFGFICNVVKYYLFRLPIFNSLLNRYVAAVHVRTEKDIIEVEIL